MQYHPHIHYIAPGGAFNTEDKRWYCSRLDFYLPVKALSKIYRAKFRDYMKDERLFHLIDPKSWDTDWNVNVAPVGTGHQTVKYLSQYVFKVALSDYRIKIFEKGQVTFRYRKTGSTRDRRITVTAHEFIRRYLQHVLPTGFMKVRHYGFMSANCSVSLADIKGLIEIHLGFDVVEKSEPVTPEREVYCPDCGSKMHYRYSVLPFFINEFQIASSFRGQFRFCRAESPRSFASNIPIETFVPDWRAS